MSPRRKILRKVLSPPSVKGFKPYGPELGKQKIEQVILLFEEYEALRLCDYDMLNHNHASEMMGVSRPTFTRIYSSVRRKIATAFAEGRQIVIEGGKVYFDSDWYMCADCTAYFNDVTHSSVLGFCPLCGSNRIEGCEKGSVEANEDEAYSELCWCTQCGYERKHRYGMKCNINVCPECNSILKRKDF